MREEQRQMPAHALNGRRFGALLQVERPIPTGTVLVRVFDTRRRCRPREHPPLYAEGHGLPGRIVLAKSPGACVLKVSGISLKPAYRT
jgi:hypothetical protein